MNREWQLTRGGHTPSLREAFHNAVDLGTRDWQTGWYEVLDEEAIVFADPAKQEIWNSFSPQERGEWLIGQFWESTDFMPSKICQILDLPSRSTYAEAARKLKKAM